MDIYRKKSNWKVLLAIIGIIILVITFFYTNYLMDKLFNSEQVNYEIYAIAQERINDPTRDINEDISFEAFITQNIKLPGIIDRGDQNLEGFGFGEDKDGDQAFLESKKQEFLINGEVPIESLSNKLYYFESDLMKFIRFFPFVMLGLITFLIALAYYLFGAARKSEQNRVWAGMAKETAHQLGTPISAIMAWIEHLKEEAGGNEAQLEIIDELSNDVDRLELVADRFSKIGSAPVLVKVNVFQQIEKCMAYMKRRAPKRVEFNTYAETDKSEIAMMNEHLFDWVVENLLRNALDSMGGSGKISANIYEENEYICVDIEDSGKGIPSSKYKTVFQPGYSTKKRGWGLGLSLAKRIIENYHSGKIFVKNSKLDEGTTFSIKLPKV